MRPEPWLALQQQGGAVADLARRRGSPEGRRPRGGPPRPGEIGRLGAGIGDVVTVTGQRTTALKVMPAYPDERGKEIVQIDGIARENAGAGLDERVTVELATIRDARTVALAPIGAVAAVAAGAGRLVRRAPGRRPRRPGRRPRPGQSLRLAARRTSRSPDGSRCGFVLIQAGTRIKIVGEAEPERRVLKVSYEDIGGLGRTVARIREMIELPLRFPEVFERLGIDPPQGRPALRPARLRQDADRPGRRQRDRGALHPRQRARR